MFSQQITGAEFTCCLLCGITKAGRKAPDISIDFSFLRLKKKNKKNLLFLFSPPSHASLRAKSLAKDEMACFEVCFPAVPPPRCLAVIVGALQGRRWGNGIRSLWRTLQVFVVRGFKEEKMTIPLVQTNTCGRDNHKVLLVPFG